MTTTTDRIPYLTPDVVAERYGFTTGQLAQLRYTGRGPRFLKPTPRRVLYREADIVAWIEGSEQTITGDAA
ncbi:MAG: helix-turn-helix transcriptional regulator [Pseudoclavibacter sp.]